MSALIRHTPACLCVFVCLSRCVRTSCYPEDPHDAYNCGVDGQGSTQVYFLQRDTHDGQQHNGEVQLVPSWHTRTAAVLVFGGVKLHIFESLCIHRRSIPLFEKAPKAKSDEFKNGLDDKDQREHVIAVLQYLLEVLQDTQTHTCTVPLHAASLLWF